MVDIFIWVGRAVCVALIAAAAIALPLTDSATGLKRCDTTERVGRTQLFMIANERNMPTVKTATEDDGPSFISIAGSERNNGQDASHSSCAEALWSSLGSKIEATCGSATSPELIGETLADLQMTTDPLVREALGSLLTEPTSFSALFDQAGACLAGNRPLAAFACWWLDNPSLAPSFTKNPSLVDAELCSALNFAVVLQRLGEVAVREPGVFGALMSGVAAQADDILLLIHGQPMSEAMRTFVMQKWSMLATPPGDFDGKKFTLTFATHIAMAAALQIREGVPFNPLLGMQLAYAQAMQTPILDTDGRLSRPLGKDWVDAYNAWNLNLVTHIPERLEFVAKLLIPAISCANFDFSPSGGPRSDAERSLAQTQAQYWTMARGVTLKLATIVATRRRAARPFDVVTNVSVATRAAWADLSARHSAVERPVNCGTQFSLEKLYAMLYPPGGYDIRLSDFHVAATSLVGFEDFTNIREDHLVQAQSFPELLSEAIPSLVLGVVVFVAAMVLETVVFASGISSRHGVLVGESFVLIFYAPPLIISFFSSGFLPTMFFILTIWHFGLSISVYRPSNALNFPWRPRPAERSLLKWTEWLCAVWHGLHHFLYVSAKLAMTFNPRHIRGCSQRSLQFGHILAISTVHMSDGIAKLVNIDALPPKPYASLATALNEVAFVARIVFATSIAVLSNPGGAAARGYTASRLLHDERWAWVHTEWHYLMIADLIWCSGALLLRQLRLAAKETEVETALYTKPARGGIGDSPVELLHVEERAEQSMRASTRFSTRSRTVRQRYRPPESMSRAGEIGVGVHRSSFRPSLACISSRDLSEQSVVVEEASLASVTDGK